MGNSPEEFREMAGGVANRAVGDPEPCRPCAYIGVITRLAAARCWTNCSGVMDCFAPGLPPPIIAPGAHAILRRLSLSPAAEEDLN